MPDRFEKSLIPLPPATQPGLHEPGSEYLMERALASGFQEPRQQIDLREYWRKVLRHKWLILVITIVVTSLVTIQAFRAKSLYRASATIEIGNENLALIKDGQILLGDDSDYMSTKLKVLQSNTLMESVAAALRLDQNPKFMEVTETRSGWEAIQAIFGRFSGKKLTAEEPTTPVRTGVRGAEGLPIIRAEDSARLAPFVNVLSSNLQAAQVDYTRIINVSFVHTDPNIAADVVNTTVNNFFLRSRKSKSDRLDDTSGWLEKWTRQLQTEMKEAEQALVDYTRNNNIYSTGGEKGNLATDKLAVLHGQVTKAGVDTILKRSLYEEVKAGRADRLPEAFTDVKVNGLQQKLSDLIVQEAQLSVKFGSTNPRVIEVRQQIEAIQNQVADSRKTLEEKLSADYERAVREEATLKTALEKAKQEAVAQNQATIQYNILAQQVETKKTLYNDFLSKTNQTAIAGDVKVNMDIIDEARPPVAPFGPNRLRTILIGLFLSLCAGIGLALLLEYLDNTVNTPDDVEKYAQLPTLALIPMLSHPPLMTGLKRAGADGDDISGEAGKRQLSPGRALAEMHGAGSFSPGAEAYRILRTSILMSTAGRQPKTILFTSSQPGEGKTTTVINTATSLAQNGASVLIIDCDLRRPSIHKRLNLTNKAGLTSYLSRNISIDDLIHELELGTDLPDASLSVVTAGPIPPNPAELVGSDHMRKLVRMFAECYDFVLLDAPPVNSVTDPLILSGMVDGTILLVHGGKTRHEMLRRTRQELAAVGARVFGVVLNNVNLKREGYEYYYYNRYHSNYYTEAERG